jgi:hypothetical protein
MHPAWCLHTSSGSQEQLVLMQRDRERLADAVSYTKGQAGSLVTMVHGVNERFSKLTKHAGLVRWLQDTPDAAVAAFRHVNLLLPAMVMVTETGSHLFVCLPVCQARLPEDLLSGSEMAVIESSLQNMVQTANRVEEIAKEAEDHHFAVSDMTYPSVLVSPGNGASFSLALVTD